MSDANMKKGDESSGETSGSESPSSVRSRTMLAQMIALEEQKLASSGAPQKLSSSATQSVKNRLLAEKDAILRNLDATATLAPAKVRKTRLWLPLGVAAAAAIAVGVILMLRLNAQPEIKALYVQGGLKTNHGTLSVGKMARDTTQVAADSRAFAVLRLGDAVTATLGPASEMQILKLARGSQVPELLLESRNGTAFFTLPKGLARLKVKTPVSEVSVVGTSFAVRVGRDATEVSVLDGTVTSVVAENIAAAEKDTIKREKLRATTVIAAKQKLKLGLNGEMTLATLAADEIAYLQKLQKITALSIDKAEVASLQRLAAEVIHTDSLLAKEGGAGSTSAPNLTLADIRAKYGKISRVNLKSGKSYTGYFRLKGAQMEIITTAGTVRVPTADLQDVQDVN